MKNRLKLNAMAMFTACATAISPSAFAGPVTFWFSGTITSINNPSNALPSGISVGSPFSGRMTYDVAVGSYSTGWIQQTGSHSNLYCSSVAGVSTLLQIAGHTITNTIIDSDRWAGSLHIADNYDNADDFTLYSGFAGLTVDAVGMTNSHMSWYLKDATKSAYSSSAFPTTPPTADAFNTQRTFNWRLLDEVETMLFNLDGDIHVISTNALAALNIRRDGNAVKLSWPTAVTGFALQCSTNLAGGNWEDIKTVPSETGMEWQVTLPASGSAMLFRLKAP